jgi:transposase InsO family protein
MDRLFEKLYLQNTSAKSRPKFNAPTMLKFFTALRPHNNDITFGEVNKWVNTVIDETLEKEYYRPGGYQGLHALKDAISAQGYDVPLERVRLWYSKQKIPSEHGKLPRSIAKITVHFNEPIPNDTHQLDLLTMPTDRNGYKYILSLVDVASRFKAAEAMKDKTSAATLKALDAIYDREKRYLKHPKLIMVDAGGEFKGDFAKEMDKRGIRIKVSVPKHHQSQGIVESFNKSLATRLFKQMENIENKKHKTLSASKHLEDFGPDFAKDDDIVSRDWVDFLEQTVDTLNREVNRMTKKRPIDAIREPYIEQPTNTPEEIAIADRVKYELGDQVKYYLDWDNVPDGNRRRATDRTWSYNTFEIVGIDEQDGRPRMYELEDIETHKPLGFRVIGTRLKHTKSE